MSETPRTDEMRVDKSELFDLGIGPSDYVMADDCAKLERELAAVTAERDALLEARAWRPIETAPKDKSSILIIDSENFITIGEFSEKRGCFANTEECWKIETPTHWMPLPEPPKGVDQ